jgi:3-methylcrotonyl-CoA carboxylase beta subunit
MTQIISQLHTSSSEFLANQTAMQKLVDQLQKTITQIALGGDEKARARHL